MSTFHHASPSLPLVRGGFDANDLPDATPGVPGAHPWSWFADPNVPEPQRTAYLERFVRGHGTVDPTDRELALAPRSRAAVIAGHLGQHVYLELPGNPPVRVRLSGSGAGSPKGGPDDTVDGGSEKGPTAPDPEGGEPPAAPDGHGPDVMPSGAFPFPWPVAIVGTTAPSSAARAAVGRRIDDELADFLAGRRIDSWPAVAVDHRHEWLDPVLIVRYDEPDMVQTEAAVHLQPHLTAWRPDPRVPAGVLEVVDLEPMGSEVVARGAAALHRITVHTCPMIPGSQCGDLCTLHGGPWVSRSITAAVRWETRRARMIRALGCDTCGDGAITVFAGEVRGGGRRAIPIRPDVSTPTRHDRLVADQGS